MKLIMLSPVAHDGELYAEGDTVEIKDEAQALSLIEAGAAEEVVGKKSAKAEKPAKDEAPAGDESAEA